MYSCKKCGLGVIVVSGKIIKACKCVAPVVADMSAKAEGKGGVKQAKRPS